MLSEEKKARIRALTTEEMRYEINLGRKSHFQRDKFAYLQSCYQERIQEENHKKQLEIVQLTASPIPSERTSNSVKHTNDITNRKHKPRIIFSKKTVQSTLVIIIGGLGLVFAIYLINYYFHLNLKP